MSSIIDSYNPERNIHDFWEILEAQWAAGAPRAIDVDGRPVFKDRTTVFDFFHTQGIFFERQLCNLSETKVTEFCSFFNLEKTAMIDIIRGLMTVKQRRAQKRYEFLQRANFEKLDKILALEAQVDTLKRERAEDQSHAQKREKILQQISAEKDDKLVNLRAEFDTLKRKRQDDREMLTAMNSGVMPGSIEDVEEIRRLAKRLALDLKKQVENMRAEKERVELAEKILAQKREQAESTVPSGSPFLCAITQLLMVDPVILVGNGHTYERESIQQWLSNHNTCPKTNLVLDTTRLMPNHNLRQAIEDYVEAQILAD